MKKQRIQLFPVDRLESDLAKSGDFKKSESINDPVFSSVFLKTLRYAIEKGLTFAQIMFIVNSVIDLIEDLEEDELICRMENILSVMEGDVEYLKRHPRVQKKKE